MDLLKAQNRYLSTLPSLSDSDDIKSIQSEIKNLLANFRSLTSETDRLRDTNAELIKRNNFLESELVEVEQIKE